MYSNANSSIVWAVCVAALVVFVGCGDPGTGIDPKECKPVVDVRIISPQEGAKVNPDKPIETPINPVANATSVCDGKVANLIDEVVWTLDGASAGNGQSPPVVTEAGSHVLKACARNVCDDVSFTIEPDHIGFAKFDFVCPGPFYVGEAKIDEGCLDVEIINPRRFELDSTLFFGNNTLGAEGGMIPVSPPVMEAGTYDLFMVVRNDEKGLLATSTKVQVTLEERPVFGYVLFVSEMNQNEIWITADPLRSTPVRLVDTPGEKEWPVLMPDSSRLLYVGENECGEGVYSATPSGGNPQNLTPKVGGECLVLFAEAPTPSPDGSRIAFVGTYDNTALFGAFVVNADGSGFRRILTKPDMLHGEVAIEPYIFWLNSREVVTGYDETLSLEPYTNRKVYVALDVETGEERRLLEDATSQSGQSLVPSVHGLVSNGGYVVLWTNFTTKEVLLLKTDGSQNLEVLNTTGTNASWPLSCQQGLSVCYLNGTRQLWSTTVGENNPHKVVDFTPGMLYTSSWYRQ